MSDTSHDALGMWEFSSVPSGVGCADAIAKGSPVARIVTGTMQPGHYLVVVTGDPASVEVANDIVAGAQQTSLIDSLFLADVASDVARSLFEPTSSVNAGGEAVGVVETSTVAGAVNAADAALKHAHVSLASLQLADGLGGRAYFIVDGDVGAVQAAVAASIDRAGALVRDSVVIAQLTPELRVDLNAGSTFRDVLRSHRAPS